MMTINQIGMQTPQQAIRSSKGQKRTQVQSAFEDSDPLGEADAVRVQSRGSGCLERESTDGIMSQQERIEFLQNKDGQFAPQGLTTQTLVILDLINDQLNGIIINNKFCMSRTGRLKLSWWRLPLRARAEVSNEVESSCEGNTRHCCPQEETHEETTMDGSASDSGVC